MLLPRKKQKSIRRFYGQSHHTNRIKDSYEASSKNGLFRGTALGRFFLNFLSKYTNIKISTQSTFWSDRLSKEKTHIGNTDKSWSWMTEYFRITYYPWENTLMFLISLSNTSILPLAKVWCFWTASKKWKTQALT